jgi:hypothetical protein
MDDSPRHAVLEAARREAGIAHNDLWLHYFALTGDAAPLEVEAFLQGLMPLPPAEQDILAHALYECLADRRQKGSGGHDAYDHPDGASPP